MEALCKDESDLASVLDPFCQSEFPLCRAAAATCGAACCSTGFLDLLSHILAVKVSVGGAFFNLCLFFLVFYTTRTAI